MWVYERRKETKIEEETEGEKKNRHKERETPIVLYRGLVL